MGAVSLNQDIINRFNVFLFGLEADGTLADMRYRWLDNVPDLGSTMPDIPLTGVNGTLRVATSAGSMPFAYMGANNELKGYSIELVRRFAAHEGLDIVFSEMEFGAMLPYVIGGRADIAIADISITEERKLSVLFTDPIYYDLGGIIVLRPGGAAADVPARTGGGFIEWLRTGIQRNLITDNRWRMVVNGLGVTLNIALFSQLFGTIFGCFICWLLMRKNRLVNWFARFYCGLIHGTPAVVLLMITYYIVFGGTRVSNIIIAVAAFTMIMGASIAQNLKGAIATVDIVEIEAARSIGFSAFRAFMTVTLPQAVRRVLPSYTNGFVELVKMTAIVGFIAIQDLTRAGDIIRSRTFDAYFPLLFVAFIYLIITTICVQVFKFIVKKVNGGVAE
jgi:polar amino acid transport system substrate-binding protein